MRQLPSRSVWTLHPTLCVFTPESLGDGENGGENSGENGGENGGENSGENGDAAIPAVVFVACAEALQWQPWALAERDEHSQRRAHEAATGGAAVLGYASWVSSSRALSTPAPLLLSEAADEAGTRVWAASWLHRAWATRNQALFSPHASVLELGAGCGLLGLSVAAACPTARVTLSDFAGHGAAGGAVMDNLRSNAARNASRCGSRVRVVELDWAHPCAARLWWSLAEPGGEAGGGPHVSLEPVDVALGTEVLYTDKGTRALVGALALLLRRPGGVCYIVNNARRTAVALLESECARHGLSIQRLPPSELAEHHCSRVASTFPPPWDECDVYSLLRLGWAESC